MCCHHSPWDPTAGAPPRSSAPPPRGRGGSERGVATVRARESSSNTLTQLPVMGPLAVPTVAPRAGARECTPLPPSCRGGTDPEPRTTSETEVAWVWPGPPGTGGRETRSGPSTCCGSSTRLPPPWEGEGGIATEGTQPGRGSPWASGSARDPHGAKKGSSSCSLGGETTAGSHSGQSEGESRAPRRGTTRGDPGSWPSDPGSRGLRGGEETIRSRLTG